MRRLKAASLIEAITASALFMIVFSVSLDLLPKLTVDNADGFDRIAARDMTERARRKYGTGVWPKGRYIERYDDAEAEITLRPHDYFDDVAIMEITARSGRTKTTFTELVICE